MIKELIIKDKAITKDELKKSMFAASGNVIDNICLPIGFFHIFPELREYTNNVALIDYPTGWNNQKFRYKEIDYAIKCGVVAIDLTINNLLLAEKDYENISKEVES
jgi:deoxyribose-phosphate aldolase